jgi:hypothetical protein
MCDIDIASRHAQQCNASPHQSSGINVVTVHAVLRSARAQQYTMMTAGGRAFMIVRGSSTKLPHSLRGGFQACSDPRWAHTQLDPFRDQSQHPYDWAKPNESYL